MRLLVRKSWTGLWWIACDADEPLGLIDSPTYRRARTREGVIAKWQRRLGVTRGPWEEVSVPTTGIEHTESVEEGS